MSYIELQITSNFTFLRGASHPEELVEQAHALGYERIAITDRNSFAGIVRGHTAAKQKGMRIIPACRLDLLDGPSLLAYPTNQQAYANLSELLTVGNLRQEKGKCDLYKADVYAHSKGMQFIIVPPLSLNEDFDFDDSFKEDVFEYKEALTDVYVAGTRHYNGYDAKQLFRIAQLPVPMVATNDVYYHIPERRQLQDILTCVREKCTIYNAGYKLQPNAERFLKSKQEMVRLFRQYPYALKNSLAIAEACTFSLDELRYIYPEGLTTQGRSPLEELTHLTWIGVKERFGDNVPQKITDTINYELNFIERMDYAYYFLVVNDMVRFARSQSILCQGRGSAANSVVCYCLGVTSVNPTKFDLLFERFVSDARNEPPDIDVDFEHERREEVIQYVYNKYGRDHAAIVATVTQQRQKGAIRDVGKAMGLSVDAIQKLSSSVWEFTDEWFEGKLVVEQGFNPNDKHLLKVLELTQQMMGFPRQLGQHTGGLVITRGKLSGLCPIMNARMQDRTCIEWNKDDIDNLGFFKIDILALGMLTCIRKAFDFVRQHYGRELTLAGINETEDPKVYEMVSHAETIGVFQIESRAQQAMLPRLKPNCFYDLVIEVAIVRPGPIQGDMVHPYLRRRNGQEPVEYPSKELEAVLGKTLGVPLFQEQAMKVAIVAADFTPAEADALRKSMATFKAQGLVKQFEDKLINGMLKKGYTKEYAERIFHQLEGFGSYGFPESHAVSFALLVYVSSWLKCYYPDVFCAALLNSQPMGFYQPAQIISDARKNGVVVRHVDINHSEWDNILEEKECPYHVVRLGFRQIKGMKEEDIQLLVAGRMKHYTHINQLRLIGLSQAALEKLADADAFRSIGLDRREALWQVTSNDNPVGLFSTQLPGEEQVNLPAMSASEHVVQDYASIALSLKAHPVSFIREKLNALQITPTGDLLNKQNGEPIRVAGLVLVRQRPGTASGVCFITVEDETGVANCVVWASLFDEFRKPILQSRLLMIEGHLQIEGEVIHVIAHSLHNLTALLGDLTATKNEDIPVNTLAYADEKSVPATEGRQPPKPKARQQVVQAVMFPSGRNFK
ncbi:MAG TPA: error-prone DNA polymerase [Chitinophagaceae bacterium]|nr:error-prone DNA polymerase [Chitinophagaceae bacterium]